jgi:CRISPR-associated protein Cas1
MQGTIKSTEATPDYLPARMLNEFVYCPRLFYYEWVEGLFARNRETVEGGLRHAKLDGKQDALTPAGELAGEDRLHARSVTLSSDTQGLIAKIDVVEADGGTVTPVDYKRGAPREDADTGQPAAWDADRFQIAAQALVLRENGYTCHEGVVYYVTTKQRVRIPIEDALVGETTLAIAQARALAASGQIPPPLVDSPKCPRCSLVGICLPDETLKCLQSEAAASAAEQEEPDIDLETLMPSLAPALKAAPAEPRRLVAARDDLRPLYLNRHGLHVGKTGNVLKIRDKDRVVQEVRIGETCQVNLFGNIQLSTQALQALCENEVPVAFFSMGNWFYGFTTGLGLKNIMLRRDQFRRADDPDFCLRMARALVAGKIKNQRTMLKRNHIDPPAAKIALLKEMCEEADRAGSLEQLLGIEGTAARVYFELLAGMIKVGEPEGEPALNASESTFSFDWSGRNRRPPRDPVNALLSLAYSVLAKDLTIVCQAVGFDPFLGFYHQPRFGRPAMALDLMEPFRPLIADSAVLSAINTRMVTPGDFIRAGESVALKPDGRKAFFRAYEQRMDTLATHPLFGYRVNYRRMLEIQTRLLARVVAGELHDYPVFVTR